MTKKKKKVMRETTSHVQLIENRRDARLLAIQYD